MNSASDIQKPLAEWRAALADLLTANGCEPSSDLIDAILSVCGANLLTDRHGDVLQLATRGWNDKEICGALGLHENTLALHWREIRARLGMCSRLQIGVALALATCRNPQVAHPADLPQSHHSEIGKSPTHEKKYEIENQYPAAPAAGLARARCPARAGCQPRPRGART